MMLYLIVFVVAVFVSASMVYLFRMNQAADRNYRQAKQLHDDQVARIMRQLRKEKP